MNNWWCCLKTLSWVWISNIAEVWSTLEAWLTLVPVCWSVSETIPRIVSATGISCRWFALIVGLAVCEVGVELLIAMGVMIMDIRVVSSSKLFSIIIIISITLILLFCLLRPCCAQLHTAAFMVPIHIDATWIFICDNVDTSVPFWPQTLMIGGGAVSLASLAS